MPRVSLHALLVLVSLCAGQALAQGQQSPHRERESDLLTSIDADQYVYRPGTHQMESRTQTIAPSEPQSDVTCYAIRIYLVVRDSPHSDTTHRDGSTTCVPAAKFRVHTAEDRPR